EIAERHLVGAAVLGGKGKAGAERDLAADDAMSAQEIDRGVEEVHGAALAPGAPGGLAVQFRHDGAGRHAPRERLAVLPVGAHDVIVLTQRGNRAHGHGFLPDVQVAESADPAEAVGLAGLLFEAAYEQHLAQPVPVLVRRRVSHGSVPCRLRCSSCHYAVLWWCGDESSGVAWRAVSAVRACSQA